MVFECAFVVYSCCNQIIQFIKFDKFLSVCHFSKKKEGKRDCMWSHTFGISAHGIIGGINETHVAVLFIYLIFWHACCSGVLIS